VTAIFVIFPEWDGLRMACKRTEFIRATMDAAQSLDELAERGLIDAEDDGCALLSGIVRDCAYKILQQAERERRLHVSAGTWEEDPQRGPAATL
jgi:hypothetical protein